MKNKILLLLTVLLCFTMLGCGSSNNDVIETKDGVIPIEVKSADNTKSKSLKSYIDKYNPVYSIRISNKNFGIDNNIKSIPLYAAYKIKSL